MNGALKLFAELTIVGLWLAAGSAQMFAQPPGMPPEPPPGQRGGRPGEDMLPPPPGQRTMKLGPPGRWWDDPAMAKKLNMTADQVKKMDGVFQASRIKLIDLNSTLRKEEALLEPLIQSDPPDDSKLLPQLDRVANARAELEKANARMLVGIRHVLTGEQWKKLQQDMAGGAALEEQRKRPKRQRQ